MTPRVELDPEPVARGKLFWTWEGKLFRMVATMPVRMNIVGYCLGEDKMGLVVISPLDPTAAVMEWLNKTGQVTFIVAPNKQHCFWAAAFKAAFPAALLVAPLGLAQEKPQLPVDVRITPLAGVQDMPGAWPAQHIDLIATRGCPLLDELVFFHKASSSLILADLAFNFTDELLVELQPGWLVRTYLNWADGRQRCRITKPFKWMMKDPVALKGSLDEVLASWEFDQVSMAHGSFIEKGGKQALLQGTYAFVDEVISSKQKAVEGGGGGLAGTGAALFTAAAVISTAVGIGIAGILKARQQ